MSVISQVSAGDVQVYLKDRNDAAAIIAAVTSCCVVMVWRRAIMRFIEMSKTASTHQKIINWIEKTPFGK